MKTFIKNVIEQIISTFVIMLICFTIISLGRGIITIPTMRIAELFLLAIAGGFLMEFAFGKRIIKHASNLKRVITFIIPFALVTFVCAVSFQWITELHVLETYIKFIGIFVICGLLSILLLEIEHSIRGKKYTDKLKEYQRRGENNE